MVLLQSGITFISLSKKYGNTCTDPNDIHFSIMRRLNMDEISSSIQPTYQQTRFKKIVHCMARCII